MADQVARDRRLRVRAPATGIAPHSTCRAATGRSGDAGTCRELIIEPGVETNYIWWRSEYGHFRREPAQEATQEAASDRGGYEPVSPSVWPQSPPRVRSQ